MTFINLRESKTNWTLFNSEFSFEIRTATRYSNFEFCYTNCDQFQSAKADLDQHTSIASHESNSAESTLSSLTSSARNGQILSCSDSQHRKSVKSYVFQHFHRGEFCWERFVVFCLSLWWWFPSTNSQNLPKAEEKDLFKRKRKRKFKRWGGSGISTRKTAHKQNFYRSTKSHEKWWQTDRGDKKKRFKTI